MSKCINCGKVWYSSIISPHCSLECARTDTEESAVDFEWNLYHDMDNRNYNDVKQLDRQDRALKEIAKSCPLLSKNKDDMHREGNDHLFALSTTRRMEIAKKALGENNE